MALIQKAFSDIITFSRSSNATRVGPTGLVEYAPHNLLTYSEQFDNAAWTKDAPGGSGTSTVTANAGAAPDGTITADRWLAGIGTSVISRLYQAIISSGSTSHTISVYLKSNTGSSQSILIREGYSTAATTVTVTTSWQRFSLPFTSVSAGNVELQIAINSGSADILVWGAQLAVGPYALDYTPTTSAAVYGPRFDFDPVTLAPKGLLVEESRTNLLTYSEQFNNAAWTTNEILSGSGQANVAAAPNGTVTADAAIATTTNDQHIVYQSFTAEARSYTYSVFVKFSGINFVYLRLQDASGSVRAYFNLSTGQVATVESGITSTSITAIGNGWYRCTATKVFQAGSAFFVVGLAASDNTPVYTGDGTSGIYIWGAQLEAGSFATSYIPTIASTVTRSADVASVDTLSPWYNATEGTLFSEWDQSYVATGYESYQLQFTDGTLNNRIVLFAGGTAEQLFVGVGGVSQAFISRSTVAANQTLKAAARVKTNDFALVLNGGAASTDTSGTVPTVTQFALGQDALVAGTKLLNGHLRRVAYYPRALSTAELQALTA